MLRAYREPQALWKQRPKTVTASEVTATAPRQNNSVAAWPDSVTWGRSFGSRVAPRHLDTPFGLLGDRARIETPNAHDVILLCSDGTYYTGSTVDLAVRLAQHRAGEGANYTRRRLPVELVHVEEFERLDQAFAREKQVQNWSRAKKQALISGECNQLPRLAKKVNWRRV